MLILEAADGGFPIPPPPDRAFLSKGCVVFRCPCDLGCDQPMVLLPIAGLEDQHGYKTGARWQLQSEPGEPLTLSPSIQRIGGCRSHFFVVEGRINWC